VHESREVPLILLGNGDEAASLFLAVAVNNLKKGKEKVL
jgi:hypothetical protein